MSQSQLDLNRLINELTDATRNKRAVTATFLGRARRLCPHVLGRKEGRWHCLFYQAAAGGGSSPGLPDSTENWQFVPLAGITDLEVVGGKWHTAPATTRPVGCFDELHAQAPA